MTTINPAMKLRKFTAGIALSLAFSAAIAQQVDYSVVSVQEEIGTDFMKITSASDYVCLPQVNRRRTDIDWFSNRILAITGNGQAIAYLSFRNGLTNVFIKELTRQGSSIQRTNRSNVIDFSFSPDGKTLCFSENRGDNNQIFTTDAANGYTCRQITSGAMDYSPVYSPDMKRIFFSRLDSRGASIWSYDVVNNFMSSYSTGINPCPVKDSSSIILSRVNSDGKGEIWKINYDTGTEECLVADAFKSFTTPSLSPDGRWIVFVGSSLITAPGIEYPNTDLYAIKTDGTALTQLTYHAADDLSPVWSHDGKYIYFISQRDDSNATANIWRMTFNY